MKAKIIIQVPTTYQLQSIMCFGIPVKHNLDGSHSAEMEFNTKGQAKAYLLKIAEKYQGLDEFHKLSDMRRDIKHGVLTIDAATAYIV